MAGKKGTDRPTIKQVAALAGVSPMTVSNALGDKPGVAAATRKLVLAAAKKLHYTPNMLARSFRTSRSDTIGVVMSVSFEEVFTTLFHGMESAADEAGFSLILANARHNPEKERKIVRLLIGKRVDGLVMTSPLYFGTREVRFLASMRLPFVLTMRTHPSPLVPTVQNNNPAGARATVDYLAKTGSRRFLFLALDTMFTSSAERIGGWKAALEDNGLKWNPKRVFHCKPAVADGRAAMAALIAGGMAFDTVVCGCDTIAIGAMEALLAAGIDIPGRARITGYDDIPLVAHARVPLTTVRQPLYAIGRAGVEMLIDRIRTPSAKAPKRIIDGELVVRDST